ncbi:MAG: peptidase C1 [Ignavibacteriales bacterium]|nr:peptidase C1 [Ignavibacteriales bacterium]
MKYRILILNLISIFLVNSFFYCQEVTKDKSTYQERKMGFYQEILDGIKEFNQKESKTRLQLKMDFSNINAPGLKEEFKYQWHNEPVTQGNTGTCWSFCATSFIESEVYRIHKRKIKLSELYTAYWEFVEKARRFVQERGNSYFSHGSQSNAIKRLWLKYGIVPLNDYSGMLPNQKFHDHDKMFNEMNKFLNYLKESNNWNEEYAIETIKSILNHYMGEPPEKIIVDGKEMTPLEYFENIVNLDLNNYVDFISTIKHPYYQKAEFEVPDNWWKCNDYYNIPLDDFMSIIKDAIRNEYTVNIGGDVSEPGIDGFEEVAIIPSFDIPSDYIDEFAREYRINNKTTDDDHGIHLVGYLEKDGKDWYLIKDSGAGARNGANKGYYFFHEDFVKLKMLSFMVHKDVAKDVLSKFQ